MDEMTLTLNSPITEEQWDALTDVDFDNTEEIYFHTKHGKEVYFVKQKIGKWMPDATGWEFCCSECGYSVMFGGEANTFKYCPECGAKMEETE